MEETDGLDAAAQEGEANILNLDVSNTQRGIKIKPTVNNIVIYLNTDENIQNLFRYNLI